MESWLANSWPTVDHEAAVFPGGQEGQWSPGWPMVGQRLTIRQQYDLKVKKANRVLVVQWLANG